MKKSLFAFVAFVLVTFISGCSHKVYERTVSVTDTLIVSDTVRVSSRPDTVRVTIPGSSQSIVTRDTSSHLEDGLYESDARWDGEMLHHSLRNKPGAQLEATVTVHDTVRVRDTEKKSNRDSNEAKTVYLRPSLKDRAWNFLSGLVVGVLSCVLYGSRKRIKETIKKALL